MIASRNMISRFHPGTKALWHEATNGSAKDSRLHRSCPGAYVPLCLPFRRAFTLIEVMVVVLMMGLLAGAAALTLNKPLREARALDAITTVRSFDETARTVARRLGRPATLRFDFTANVLQRFEDNRLTQQIQLPFGFRVSQVRTAARRASEGDAQILCSPLGITRTYAVRIQGSGDFNTWLLVSGLSGEVTPITDESKLDAIFSATATRSEAANASGNDAD